MKDLESESLSHTIVEEFLLDLKEKFKGKGNKTVKGGRVKENKARSKRQWRNLYKSLKEQQEKVNMKKGHW